MFPEDPGKTVVQAHTIGLKALVSLLRERTNKDTKHLYSKAQNRLDAALKKWNTSLRQGQPDFSPVADREKRLRDLELENIWETTASYGNTETKRVRNEREGIVGPLNKLINIFGAKLRDYFLLMYPLETPVKIGQQKRKTIWGYTSDEVGPVPVAHGADLAELDLADMIRSHGRELCRKSLIFGVPPNDFDSYALLLIRRLAPFVDYIYADTKLGSSHFLRPRASVKEKCADEILRELVDELNGLYVTGSSKQVFPSRTRTGDDKPLDEKFFQYQITELQQASRKVPKEEARKLQTWTRFLKELTPKKNPKLKAQDARHLYKIVRNKARYEGIRYHRLITDGLPQTYTAESVVLRGDRFLQPGEDYLLVGESRLGTGEGPGRIDLGLFVRTMITNPKKPGQLVVMKPVAVFDMKTRTSFDWEIRTEKSKGKRNKTVPRFIVRKRGMTDEEWNDALVEVPEDDDVQQLSLYAGGLVEEYRRLTGDESLPDILKGIVLLDTQFDIGLNRTVVRSLLDILVEDHSLKSKLKGCDRLLIRSKDPIAQRAALVIHSLSEDQFTVLESEKNPQETEDKFDPFSEVQDTATRHILYLSAKSASNSGFTAAWLARYWHGLHYLQKLSSWRDNTPITWLDLSGEFSHDELVKKRLRLSCHEKGVQSFFDNIKIIDMSHSIEQFLFQGGNHPEIESLSTKGIVVISGWQWIEDSLPPRLRPVLEELERYMIQEISKTGSTSVWFLQPRPDERTSEKYHSRCLLPFWNSSKHRLHVTDIVWNLPVRPYTSVQTTPMLDDLRVIVKQTRESVKTELIEVPILENWSARFWSKKSKRTGRKKGHTGDRGRDALSAEDIIRMNELGEELIKDSIDLIPWLCVLHPNICKKMMERDGITLSSQVIPLYGKPMKPKSIMARVRYRARVTRAKGKRGYVSHQQLIPNETITHPRHYRRYRRMKRRTLNTQTYRAPDESHLEFRSLREQTARNVELRRLRQVLKLLVRQKESWATDVSWLDLLKQLERIIPAKGVQPALDDLNRVSELFMVHAATSDLWGSMQWFRERRLGVCLRLNEQDQLEMLLESRPYVTSLYGNYLILLLAALTRKYPDLPVEQIQSLWMTMKSWHLRQVGFYLRDVSEVARPKFDVRAVWSNLCKRASVLSQIPLPVQSAVRYGQLLVAPSGDGYEHWVFLEDHYDQNRLRSGLWIGMNPLDPGSSIRWSESNASEIADHASTVEPQEVHSLLTCKMEGTEYVWFFAEGNWNLLGELVIIPRKKSAITNIRGLQVVPMSSSRIPEVPAGVTIPTDLPNRIENEFLEIGQMKQHIISVQCELGIDSGTYSINIKSNGEKLDIRYSEQTSDLLRILRRPLVDGIPLQSTKSPNVYFTWDPYRDIEYAELQLLRPYVERKTPFVHASVPLPLTSQELAEQVPRKMSVIIAHDENRCPLVDGSAETHGTCWVLRPESSTRPADFNALFDKPLNDQDVSSLLAAREVFLEGSRYALDLEFENDLASREGGVYRESSRIARQLGLKRLLPGTFLWMDHEKLECSVRRDRDGIGVVLSAISDATGEQVYSWLITSLSIEMDVQTALSNAINDIENIVTGYFGEGEEPEERVRNYDSLIDDMESILVAIHTEHLTTAKGEHDSEGDLEALLELKKKTLDDPELSEEIADILEELTKFHLKKRNLQAAHSAVVDSLEILEERLRRWKADSDKERFKRVEALKRRIEKKM
ncbi:MAG: hypothetical protein ACE5H4_01770 [Candidatus Thorarchaeota archaeon]